MEKAPENAPANPRKHVRTLSLEAWKAEGERRFGPDVMTWRFVCPMCGHVATPADWKAVGAPDSVAFSCVGRWKENARDAFGQGPGPCNYAGGGLFRLNPVTVAMPDGRTIDSFEFAE